jgi:hypothetical protein
MLHGVIHWKATIHIYSVKKFQKIHKIMVFTAACPKMQKAVLAPLIYDDSKNCFNDAIFWKEWCITGEP